MEYIIFLQAGCSLARSSRNQKIERSQGNTSYRQAGPASTIKHPEIFSDKYILGPNECSARNKSPATSKSNGETKKEDVTDS
jgi:hypothetical protein